MARRAPIAAPVLLALVLSCGPGPDQPVREAFGRFLDGLERADAAALWELADADTHALFDGLAAEVRQTSALVDAHWPADQRAAARRAIGGDFVGGNTTGATLFGAVLDPRRLQAPRDPAARRIDRVELAGTEATVVLKSGETLVFRQDASGAWHTPVFLAAFRDLPAVASLKDNLAVAKANAAILAAGREAPSAAPGGSP
jgi:hypothetical protein